MGLLAPLYFAGLLAIALPILFHLIRRTPQGRQVFSSLMFLSPSPPRITRRSRLTNIVLLLLRAAALALLALAFVRPFFNRVAEAEVTPVRGRRVGILVDASASMRRGDLWQQARRQVDDLLRNLSPADEVGLFLFDRRVRPAMTFREWNELDPSRRAGVLAGRLADASPTWSGTRLGDALATVADLLAEAEGAKDAADKATRQLVLVSDLQQGGHVESLQGYTWPDNVRLDVRPVALKEATNATLQPVKVVTDGTEKDDGRLRVRVTNQPGAGREQFALAWADARGPLTGVEPFKVYAPPGRSQIARVPWPAQGTPPDRLVLSGDDADFDNTLYVAPPRKDAVRVVYVGDDAPDDVKGLRYYLQTIVADAGQRQGEIVARRPDEPLTDADLLGTRLAVVSATVADNGVDRLRRFAETGGDVLWVLKDATPAPALARTNGLPRVEVSESPTTDFSLVSRVELSHPLFSPFADARFSDFTKVHFWKHRKVAPGDGVKVLAVFDDGDPFLFEKLIGQGRLLVATSGWHPADSQFALSTKFVPLIDGLLRRRDAALTEAQYAVDDPVALPPPSSESAARAMVLPDGRRVEIARAATTFDGADRPGLYRLVLGDQEAPLAVNLPAEESRTAPVPVEELEKWGARLAPRDMTATPAELAGRQHQSRISELENRQKLWRWLIVGVLGLLAAETALAGRLARGAFKAEATT